MRTQLQVVELARRAGEAALGLLLPVPCASCGSLPAPGGLCARCSDRLHRIVAPYCRRCGAGFEAGEGGSHCAQCLAAPPPWGEARAARTSYDDGSKGLLLGFKHADRVELAGLIATHMASAGAALLAQAELVVPVPLHPARLRQRRFNQAALLARRLARGAGRPSCLDALSRLRRTSPLVEHGASARAAMLDGAIAVTPSRLSVIAGRRVLLIDDVLTSGATARACTSALLDGGAQSVDLLVAARAARAF